MLHSSWRRENGKRVGAQVWRQRRSSSLVHPEVVRQDDQNRPWMSEICTVEHRNSTCRPTNLGRDECYPSRAAQKRRRVNFTSRNRTIPDRRGVHGLSHFHLATSCSAPSSHAGGVDVNSLGRVEIVHPSIRRNITQGKDVSLPLLLIPHTELMDLSTVETSDGFHTLKNIADQTVLKNLTLPEFIKAFVIYKEVMCEAFPSRRK